MGSACINKTFIYLKIYNWEVHIFHILVFCIISFFWNWLFLQYMNTNICKVSPPPQLSICCHCTTRYIYCIGHICNKMENRWKSSIKCVFCRSKLVFFSSSRSHSMVYAVIIHNVNKSTPIPQRKLLETKISKTRDSAKPLKCVLGCRVC